MSNQGEFTSGGVTKLTQLPTASVGLRGEVFYLTQVDGLNQPGHYKIAEDSVSWIFLGADSITGAEQIPYDNAVSGLTATDVKAALDEIDGRTDDLETDSHTHSNKTILDNTTASFTTTDETKLDGIEENAKDDQDANEVPFSNLTSGMAATDVQAAIDEVDGRLDSLETDSHTHSNQTVLDNTTASFTTDDETKLDNIEAGATADQTAAEIETAYNSQVAIVSQVDAEAGTSTTAKRWTAERVKQAIESLAPAPSDASETVKGIIELATQTEVNSGTDALRALTPATLAGSSLASAVAANTAKVSNVTTNLSSTQTTTTVDIVSSDGIDATIPQAVSGGNAGVMSGADKQKLEGIASGATANDTDANLKARANHTGTQTASTISDFDSTVAANTTILQLFPLVLTINLSTDLIANNANIASATGYTTTARDIIVRLTGTIPANSTITMPAITSTVRRITVKDSGGNGLTSPTDFTLKIVPSGSDSIDSSIGLTNQFELEFDKQAQTFLSSFTGTIWEAI